VFGHGVLIDNHFCFVVLIAGIGIVKLMGRSAGYIAAHATMASGDVDLCLVPEVPLVLDGETGCLPHLWRRVKQQGYAVVVVAEGAGEEVLGTSAETDASGNKKLPAIGEFMKKQIEKYFQEQGEEATIKYLDPRQVLEESSCYRRYCCSPVPHKPAFL
jgi:6-phosphofructokinase 1